MGSSLQLANGMTASQSRKWLKFYFDIFFDKAIPNKNKQDIAPMVLDIYVYEKVKKGSEVLNLHEYIDVEEFKRYWAPEYNLILVEIKQ